ncbi:hypothetical protein JTB14_001768 [Gonioctena quinquepunctata]|nr:hypothetical protein JTB14_001768 [Gonioctena quinquepunctata]
MFRLGFVFMALLVFVSCDTGKFSEVDCGEPVEKTGPSGESCRANIPVFTWSASENKCVSDFYGGCYSTNNRFRTLEDCEKIAKPLCHH